MSHTLTPEVPVTTFRLVSKKTGNLLVSLTNIYAIILILVLLARHFIGERWLLVAFFNSCLHLLWLPALVLLPLAVWRRRPRTAILLAPVVLAFLVTYGGQFIPRSAVMPDNARELTILTYNVFGKDDDMSDRIPVIREANADIVALQEFSPLMNRTVLAELRDMYPYMALHAVNDLTAGQAVLSRYPIVEDTFWENDWLPNPHGHQRVVLDVDGVPVVLYNIHNNNPVMTGEALFKPEYRNREVQELLRRLEGESGHVLMMGDFNMPDLSDDYARITARYQDAYRSIGWGLGWTFMIPTFLRLDYVFYNEGFQPLEAHVKQVSGSSDHKPLVVKMAMLTGES